MGVRNDRQRLSVDRSRCVSHGAARRSMAMFLPLFGDPFADQLNTESATLATCSRAFRSDLRRAIALIP
jgi:hypothetical protein